MTRCHGDVFLVVLLSVVLGATVADADVAVSQFQWQKLLAHFCLADADHNQTIVEGDYDRIVRDTLAASNCKTHILEQKTDGVVAKAFAAFPKVALTWADYQQYAKKELGSASQKTTIVDLTTIMWGLWTCNSTKGMTESDLKVEFKGLQIDVSLAEAAFKKMSSDGKVITVKDYNNAAIVYFTSNTETDNGNYFFGHAFPTCNNSY